MIGIDKVKVNSCLIRQSIIITVDPVYSERVSAVKKCSLAPGIHYKRI